MSGTSRLLAVGACVTVAIAGASPAVAEPSLAQAESRIRENIYECSNKPYTAMLYDALDDAVGGAKTAAELRKGFRDIVKTQVPRKPFDRGCLGQLRKDRHKGKG
jgi:hypothetical protein